MLILSSIKNFLLILLILLCLFSLENIVYVSDFILLSLFLSILFLNLVINPKWTFLNLLNIITITLNILGVFAIEHSNSSYYLYEIEQWISYEGSIPLLFLYQISFLLGIKFFVKERALNILIIRNVRYKSIFLFMLYFLLILTYVVILKHKPAPLLGVDRFAYDKDILGVWGQITNILFYFSLGLGILFFKEKNKLYIFLLLLIQLAFLLKGHKFWNLIEIFFLFFIPYVIYILRTRVIKIMSIIFLGVGSLIIAAISINVYYFPSFEPMDYARQRLSQEGQLWWSTYKNYPDSVRAIEIKNEITTYLNYNEDNQYDVGMYKVMKLNTTPERFEWKLDKLSRFTYSTPALVFYHLGGYLGMLMMCILGCLFGSWFKLVFYSIIWGDLLISLILSRAFYIIRKVVKDGDVYKLFSLEILFIILAGSILYLFSKYNFVVKNKRQSKPKPY